MSVVIPCPFQLSCSFCLVWVPPIHLVTRVRALHWASRTCTCFVAFLHALLSSHACPDLAALFFSFLGCLLAIGELWHHLPWWSSVDAASSALNSSPFSFTQLLSSAIFIHILFLQHLCLTRTFQVNTFVFLPLLDTGRTAHHLCAPCTFCMYNALSTCICTIHAPPVCSHTIYASPICTTLPTCSPF